MSVVVRLDDTGTHRPNCSAFVNVPTQKMSLDIALLPGQFAGAGVYDQRPNSRG
jgi:hypothetical protein